MSGVPVPRLRGIAYALDVIEKTERTAHRLAATVEAAIGRESPVAKELRSLAWQMNQSAEVVKSDIAEAQAGEAGTAETVKQGSVHEHAVPQGCAQNQGKSTA